MSRDLHEILASLARTFEEAPDECLEILRDGGSSVAGDLDLSPEYRRFGALTALVAEGALDGLASWDDLLDFAYAAREMDP